MENRIKLLITKYQFSVSPWLKEHAIFTRLPSAAVPVVFSSSCSLSFFLFFNVGVNINILTYCDIYCGISFKAVLQPR